MSEEAKRSLEIDSSTSFNENIKKPSCSPPKSLKLFDSSKNLSVSSFSCTSEFEDFRLKYQQLKMKQQEILNSTDDEMDVEDEIEIPNDPFLDEFKNKTDYNINDVMRGVMHMIEKQSTTDTKIASINKELSKINKKVDINKKNINTLNANANTQYQLILKNIAAVNFLEQSKIDNEVFVSGFRQAVEETFIDQICLNYEINADCFSHKLINLKNQDNSFRAAFINITFVDKQNQISFLKKVKEKGPIIIPSSSSDPITIKFSRKLSAENRKVIAKLVDMLKRGVIGKIRYRNCFYEALPPNSPVFVPIQSEEHLKSFTL